MIGVAVLGSTGSIGESTLDVLARHPQQFRVVALAAGSNVDKLEAQCRRWQPDFAALGNADAAQQLALRLRAAGLHTQVSGGPEALEALATLAQVDYVMAAIVGAAGLQSTLAAARAGKRLLLANKEALVMSGHLLLDAVRSGGATLIPIDSEHNAIFQCLPHGTQVGTAPAGVRRLLLTASGGPFRDFEGDLRSVTPEQACAHPNWVMGRKISVDSATLMNKGLELAEACLLFGLPPSRVDVVIHPQSVIHSMVEYLDGSVLAQLGSPDMRTPIAHALAWPQRFEAGVHWLDIIKQGRLDFRSPDLQRFPCLRLAGEAIAAGGTSTALLNAANEVAVEAFLDRRLNFLDIAAVIESVLVTVAAVPADTLGAVLSADAAARAAAREQIARRVSSTAGG
jgi:1-deoxy-D-xylulose-5-phosphate reductoisomerase